MKANPIWYSRKIQNQFASSHVAKIVVQYIAPTYLLWNLVAFINWKLSKPTSNAGFQHVSLVTLEISCIIYNFVQNPPKKCESVKV